MYLNPGAGISVFTEGLARVDHSHCVQMRFGMVDEPRRLVFDGDDSPDDETRLDLAEATGLARPNDVLVA